MHYLLTISFALLTATSLSAQDVPTTVLKVVDVRDLVANEAPADPRAARDVRSISGPGRSPGRGTGRLTCERLADLVEAFIQPGLSRGEEITPRQDTLLVRVSPDKHRWVGQVLEVNRGKASKLVNVTSDLLVIESRAFRIHVRPLLRGKRQVVLPEERGRDLVAKLGALRGTGNVISLGVTIHPMTTAMLRRTRESSYIGDFDVELASAPAIAEPVVDVVADNTIRCTAAFLGEGIVGTALTLAAVERQQPAEESNSKTGAGKEARVQPPKADLGNERVWLRIAKGEAALLALPVGGKHLIALVRASIADIAVREKPK